MHNPWGSRVFVTGSVEQESVGARAVGAGKRTIQIAAKMPRLLRQTTLANIRDASKLLVPGETSRHSETRSVGSLSRTPSADRLARPSLPKPNPGHLTFRSSA